MSDHSIQIPPSPIVLKSENVLSINNDKTMIIAKPKLPVKLEALLNNSPIKPVITQEIEKETNEVHE